MTAAAPRPRRGFPKSARLRKSADFRFRPYRRFEADGFIFYFTSRGTGRLGISISRKTLRNAAARNRVRRLLKESFRLLRPDLLSLDVHVVGGSELAVSWPRLKRQDIERTLEKLLTFSRTEPERARMGR